MFSSNTAASCCIRIQEGGKSLGACGRPVWTEGKGYGEVCMDGESSVGREGEGGERGEGVVQ